MLLKPDLMKPEAREYFCRLNIVLTAQKKAGFVESAYAQRNPDKSQRKLLTLPVSHISMWLFLRLRFTCPTRECIK